MLRFKVKLPSDEAFRAALSLLQGRVAIFVESEKRRFLSTGTIPHDLATELAVLKAQVSQDYQLDLDGPTPGQAGRQDPSDHLMHSPDPPEAPPSSSGTLQRHTPRAC